MRSKLHWVTVQREQAYLLDFQYPDSGPKNQVFLLQSSQEYADHIGLCRQKLSEAQTLQVYSHYKISPHYTVNGKVDNQN